MLDHYRQRVAGTNIDPRSLLSTDYFNQFNSVIILFGMLPDAPELLDEIFDWKFIGYVEHFKTSGLDFADLAIEAYEHAPANLRDQFELKIEEMRFYVERSREKLKEILAGGEKERFNDMAIHVSRELQKMADTGGAIVHGHDASMDQGAIDQMF